MLPTESISDIIHISKGSCANTLVEKKHYGMTDTEMGDTNQHLYAISDDKSEDGDWCIMFDGLSHSVGQMTKEVRKYVRANKIIATTDDSLTRLIIQGESDPVNYDDGKKLNTNRVSFQIHESFVPIFIKAYNECNPLVEIALEIVVGTCPQCEGACHAPICTDCHLCHGKAPYFLKVDSGCVVIAKRYAMTLKVVDQYTSKDADIYMESDKAENLAYSADKLIRAMSMMVNMNDKELAEIAGMIKKGFDEKQ